MADKFENGRIYNDPVGGKQSSIGPQLNTFYWNRKSLIDARKDQYFTQLADVTAMPKHHGKHIKMYHYIPLLDDRNINDQGIDATGAVIANGNLYGSSKDIGTILDKLPALSETGGRVNRVGFVRKELEGTFNKFGFFSEYTQASLEFDTDDQLMDHVSRETVTGAVQMSEAALQIDILNAAGTVKFAGAATKMDEVDEKSLVTYTDLMKLSIDLDNNRTPKHTTIVTGTRLTDTRTISAARVMYIGSELIPMLRSLKDLHDAPAFIPLHQYAAGTTVLTGEIGSIDAFRVVVVPEMLKWAGKGKEKDGASDVEVHTTTVGGKEMIDVFPMLVVGDGSFTTIGFQTDGKTVKFTQYHKAPGENVADRHDPYGETGFMSIKWFYGFMALRPERIGLIHVAGLM